MKQKGGKFITGLLVACGDHDNNDLTSKVDQTQLCENSRLLIAQLKLINRENAKKQLAEDIYNETSNHNLNTTFVNQDAEIETLMVENTLLKELNLELREKCELLKEKMNTETPKIVKNSYAEIAAQERSKQTKIPTLIVKKTNDSESIDQVSTKITSILMKEKSIKSKFIRKKGER